LQWRSATCEIMKWWTIMNDHVLSVFRPSFEGKQEESRNDILMKLVIRESQWEIPEEESIIAIWIHNKNSQWGKDDIPEISHARLQGLREFSRHSSEGKQKGLHQIYGIKQYEIQVIWPIRFDMKSLVSWDRSRVCRAILVLWEWRFGPMMWSDGTQFLRTSEQVEGISKKYHVEDSNLYPARIESSCQSAFDRKWPKFIYPMKMSRHHFEYEKKTSF
jgi:hypothetical protein